MSTMSKRPRSASLVLPHGKRPRQTESLRFSCPPSLGKASSHRIRDESAKHISRACGTMPELIDLTRDSTDCEVTSQEHHSKVIIDLTGDTDDDDAATLSCSDSDIPSPLSSPRYSGSTPHHHLYYTAMENGEHLKIRQKASGGVQAWDTFQNFVVNTVEDPESEAALQGVEHYRRLIARKHYKHIQTDISPYVAGRIHPPTMPIQNPPPDTSTEEPKLGALDKKFSTDTAPNPVELSKTGAPIYVTKTYNPLLALAITRIAEKNLPFVDFTSALNHLPNLEPSDPLPVLPVGRGFQRPSFKAKASEEHDQIFLGDIPYKRKATDQKIEIVFIPDYYEDERHCLGFHTQEIPNEFAAESMLYTPCSQGDLEAMGLLRVSHGPKSRYSGKEDDGREALMWVDLCVGAGRGQWLEEDEEEEEWGWWHGFVEEIWGNRWVKNVARAGASA